MGHKEEFTKIYDNDIWGGSGGGSTPETTIDYRKYLETFIKEKNIKSVIDYGCGDWGFSSHIDWNGVLYLGLDCVESVIKKNIETFGSDNIKFDTSEIITMSADLLIIKDVFQHWSNLEITNFLDLNVSFFKYILITNTSNQIEDNQDNGNHSIFTRPLTAKLFPLKKYNPIIVLETNINEPKETSLIINI
jgi:hypothetical protein